MTTSVHYFSGEDRVEHAEAFGRPLRMGRAVADGVSDVARMRQLFSQSDTSQASALGSILHTLNGAVVSTFLEWSYALPHVFAESCGEAVEREVSERAYKQWVGGCSRHAAEAAEILSSLLAPAVLTSSAIAAFRENAKLGSETAATQLLHRPSLLFVALETQLREAECRAAAATFEEYVQEIRERHDLCAEYVSIYTSRVAERVGQDTAVEIMQEGLESCALLGAMWDAVRVLDSAALAAMLAEHLRTHFSGPNREGAVRIVEEPECYRLIFAPCGTGGAMRQRSVDGLAILAEATPTTWNLAKQVPSYCTHCACNELTSLKRLGSIAWVTEFDPDPEKPCGWTVYKDRSKVPARYLRRLGVISAPS